ncbi:phage tail sheath C-terminal domain-containing protein [Christiangramia crocea]|uniref:Phage tail protein n=1 Tax=Christiangramia crocea TaxID=2904124 RepID=A0A9X1UY81_9FLAO|nr:phage tail sheath C-terminal domain-containing protein [Gramella crocea]MCG9972592.1 phage tail protein [Gramella crocea]
MRNYKTPGVYVEELSLLPPSVAQVETAIPAFIGYTEMAKGIDDEDLTNKPVRIKSLLEYEQLFGKDFLQELTVILSNDEPYRPRQVSFTSEENPYRMYNSLKLFFANGGGPCYIVSVGTFEEGGAGPVLDAIDDYSELKKGLDEIRKIDEITLILFPEADKLTDTAKFDLYKDALAQCASLQDRFCIFDVEDDDVSGITFRNNIGISNLSYGAAYYPYLNTSLNYSYRPSNIYFQHTATNAFNGISMDKLQKLAEVLEMESHIETAKTQAENAQSNAGSLTKPGKLREFRVAFSATEKAVQSASEAKDLVEDGGFTSSDFDDAETKLEEVRSENISTTSVVDDIDGAITKLVAACEDVRNAIASILAQINTETGVVAAHNENIREFYTGSFLASIENLLKDFKLKMPPSGAIAGIYAMVDETRGVWKSPANVSLNLVAGPSVKIDSLVNDNFNVHSSGKSINVIRSFTGKGTLVWGARTLDGNSNEWRYISVRRFYNMVEESVKEASEQFVFEPNDANTWVKVKAMIENFLILQWRAGALMGSKPEHAFFVKIGLGETMTQDDVLNGKMIVEIGLAVTRPAEFIILRFSHKMLEA